MMCPVTHERRCHHVSGTFRLCLPHAVPSHVAAALILVPLLCAHRSSGSSAECLSRFAWPLTIKAVPSRLWAPLCFVPNLHAQNLLPLTSCSEARPSRDRRQPSTPSLDTLWPCLRNFDVGCCCFSRISCALLCYLHLPESTRCHFPSGLN